MSVFIVAKPSMNFLYFTYVSDHLLLFGQRLNLDNKESVLIKTSMLRLDSLLEICETSI